MLRYQGKLARLVQFEWLGRTFDASGVKHIGNRRED